MQLNNYKVSNYHKSKGMNALCDVSCIHNPVELPYIQWFDWAEKQNKKGKKQKQCPVCKKWFYPCEY